MTTIDSVRPVTVHEQQQAIASLVLAFGADPMMRWAFPDAQRYLEHFPRFVSALGGRAFDSGTAYCTGDFVAAALWLPPGVKGDEEALVEVIQQGVPESRREALLTVAGRLEEHHPAEPHWYLPLIGVDPPHQGRGFGSTLLQRALEECDAGHHPAYLESSNPRNLPLYERHGFEVRDEIQVEDSPPLWPMLRSAR